MVKKRQDDAVPPAPDALPEMPVFEGPLGSAVRESAQQIWQAGLGAFVKAQGEGGKLFESLVREGMTLQKRTQAAAEERWGAVGTRVQRLTDEVQARAGQHWDRLESIFEQRVAKALGRLGVPTVQDLEALRARLDVLRAQVAALGAERAPSKPARPAKASGPAGDRPGAASKAARARGAVPSGPSTSGGRSGRSAAKAAASDAAQPAAGRSAKPAGKSAGKRPTASAKSPRRRKAASGSDGD
jgi:poly(hydroxyalkanoate) granule-associated protein